MLCPELNMVFIGEMTETATGGLLTIDDDLHYTFLRKIDTCFKGLFGTDWIAVHMEEMADIKASIVSPILESLCTLAGILPSIALKKIGDAMVPGWVRQLV